MNEPSGKTRWHRILGKLFELLFTASDVTVKTDFPLMSDPPRADIMLMRRLARQWSMEHKARLPDGVRDSLASHLLLEFKYTESLNQRRIEKVHGYDILYRETQGLGDDEVASFILSSKTPRQGLLDQYGYRPTQWPGVYRSEQVMVNRVGLLVLNDLRPEPHNAFVKCFASRRRAKETAFDLLGEMGFEQLPATIFSFLSGLHRLVLPKGEHDNMLNIEITPEDVMALGKEWQAALLASIPKEERLRGLEPYIEEQKEAAERQAILRTIIQNILRTLRVRFKLAPETLDNVASQLQPFTLIELDALSEIALTAKSFAIFQAECDNLRK